MAAAPAALVMPIDAFAAEQVTIIGSGIVGAELTVDLPTGTSNPKYEWFYVDANGESLIANTEKYKVEAKDIGKTIVVKVKADNGETYESNKIVAKGSLPIKGDNYVNGKLTAEIQGVPGDPDDPKIFTHYQWYIVDGDTVKPIAGATDIELILPVEASHKNVFIEAKTEKWEVYVSEKKEIQELNLEMDKLQFEGYGVDETTKQYVVPGDALKIKAPEIKTILKVDANSPEHIILNANQITYTYQWLCKEGDNYSAIQNATTASYTIPANALDLKMNQIVVKVTAQVGDKTVSAIAPDPIMVSNDPVTSLTTAIEALLNKSGKVTYSFKLAEKSKVTNLEALYQGLTPAAKAQIKNYNILQRALADIDKVEKITGKINSVLTEIEKGVIKKEEYQQQLLSLKAEYDQLDFLQRSLDPNNDYDELLKLLIENPNNINELNKLKEINDLIDKLLDDNQSSVPIYTTKSTGDLDSEIKKIENEINSLSKEYKTAVQNQDILSMAKADVKSAQKFEKMFDKLKGLTPKKQVSTAKSIRTAYLKLSLRQQGLVGDRLEELKTAENAEGEAINNLKDEIAALSIVPVPVNAETWNAYVKSVNSIVSAQKNLTSYKDVAKINEFIQMQRDLKAAEKVIAQIEKYRLLNPSVTKYSKLQSAYNSALKALNKLTIVQQKYVYNQIVIETAPKNPEDKPSDGGTESSSDSVAGKNFSVEITNALATGTSDFQVYAQAIETLASRYKNELPKGARKYVTNYASLKTADANVKAVRSFEKKVIDALAETDSNKRYSKLQSVAKAYNKLNAIQQELATAYNSQVTEAIGKYSGSFDELNREISTLGEADKYLSLEEVRKIIDEYNALSPGEKKLIKDAQKVKQATNDVKKVDSFIKNFNKNIDKKPSTILKDFRKLTKLQISLLEGYTYSNAEGPNINLLAKIIELETGEQTVSDNALELIKSIDGLTVNGYYVEGLESKVTEIRTVYDPLSSEQKKLVKNYSRLTQAESDLQKVEEVYALKGVDQVAWQKAFNKLSRKLESLYNQIDTPK